MVIDFCKYLEMKKAQEAAQQAALAALEAEEARQAHLEMFLTDMLAELEAA